MNLRLIEHINKTAPAFDRTKPYPISLNRLWDGVPDHFGRIPMSDDRRQVMRMDTVALTVEDQVDPWVLAQSAKEQIFRIFPNNYSASLFVLFSNDRKDFYLLDGPSALGYPRMQGEGQTVLGRVLEIKPNGEFPGAMEITFDLLNRDKEVFDVAEPNSVRNEFFSPFPPPSAAVKPISFWESRISDPQMLERTDNGERPKVEAMVRELGGLSGQFRDREVNVFDPSCGTGYPMQALYHSGAFDRLNFHASDISRTIARFAERRLGSSIFPARTGAEVKLDVRVGDALGDDFTKLDERSGLLDLFRRRKPTAWPENGSIDILMLRFLNQGIIPYRETALQGFQRLAEKVRSGGYIFYFGYSALFLDSFDFENLGCDLRTTSTSADVYQTAFQSRGGWSLMMTRGYPWYFPFYFMQKR